MRDYFVILEVATEANKNRSHSNFGIKKSEVLMSRVKEKRTTNKVLTFHVTATRENPKKKTCEDNYICACYNHM